MKKLLLSAIALCGFASFAFAGDGTKESPYTVSEFLGLGDATTAVSGVYVKGYIVGAAESVNYQITGHWDAPFTIPSNILIAGSSSEEDITMCVPVELPKGNYREALNLVDHPENLGHQIILSGTRQKYFSVTGLKAPKSYEWVGEAPTPGQGGGGATTLYEGLLEKSATLSGWTIETVVECSDVENIFSWKTYNGSSYLNGSTNLGGTPYTGAANAISDVIDLTDAKDLSVSFDHCARYQNSLKELCWFGVRVEGATDWTKLEIPTWPPSGAWTWANSGTIDLQAYNGKKIQLCFHYEGSAELGADTWEIRNVKITGEGTPVTPDDPTPVDPVDPASYIYQGLVSGGDNWTIDNGTLPEGLTYVWTWDEQYKCMKGSAYKDKKAYATNATITSPVIDLTGYTDCELLVDNQLNYLRTDKIADVAKTFVKVEGAEPVLVDVQPMPAGSDFTKVEGKASLKEFEGKKIQLIFNYISTDSNATTWEVSNVRVAGNSVTAVATVEIEEGAPVYFNLQGVKVANPEKGIYVKVVNGKSSKVVVK